MKSKAMQDKLKHIENSSQDIQNAAISQLELFIRYAEKPDTKDDLIQVAKSVKEILPKLWQEVNT